MYIFAVYCLRLFILLNFLPFFREQTPIASISGFSPEHPLLVSAAVDPLVSDLLCPILQILVIAFCPTKDDSAITAKIKIRMHF